MKLKITKVILDPELQAREKMHKEYVEAYTQDMLNGDVFPPVTVFFDGVKYYLTDGWHRFQSAMSAGFTEIEAEIIEGTRRQAILQAIKANATHGLRRTNADKRKSVLKMLDDVEWSEWSDSEIARACVVSSVFVNKIRTEVKGDAVPAVRKVKRGNTEYVMDTKKIGDTKSDENDDQVDYEEDKIEEMATEFKAIAERNEELEARLAVGLMDGTEEEKKQAQRIIEEQAERIKSLEAQVKGLTASRDSYQLKNGELLKQLNYWKKQAEK